ncbi:sulfatase-like hydrolase/transferase [Halovivax limisalsi]|uniref:sulfatase-like hydrolase/transferase n=1 Tax=Halovivax limisalsi TaxID=1453760 RepID=UPI001FFC2CA9|nr:sulfatase-like hydrolase/transferase [Halovivax limisalsi]
MGGRIPVLLLTIDTLRRDRFTEACFPRSMDWFADDFAIFSNALSHGNSTPFAFPAILTSHPVVGDGEFPDGARTIAESMSDRPCFGFSNNAHLDASRGYDRGFTAFGPYPPDDMTLKQRLKQHAVIGDSDTVYAAYRSVKRIRHAVADLTGVGDGDPFPNPLTPGDVVTDFVTRQLESHPSAFAWGHYMDPHVPYHPDLAIDGPETDRSRRELEALYERYLGETELPDTPETRADLELLQALYESNVRYVDRELDRLFGWLSDRNIYEDALIVVVGDHGELFGEGGIVYHPWDVDPVDGLVRTPLLVKYPENAYGGIRFDHLVQHADIPPTISDVLDLPSSFWSSTAYPLTDTRPRRVVSKSNTAIRLTEPDAVAYKRRNGTEDGVDTLSERGRALLEASEYPSTKTSSGEVAGVAEAERQKQLAALGYR